MPTDSIAGDSKEIAHNVKVFKVILLVEVTIVLGLPETAGTHVQTTLAFL